MLALRNVQVLPEGEELVVVPVNGAEENVVPAFVLPEGEVFVLPVNGAEENVVPALVFPESDVLVVLPVNGVEVNAVEENVVPANAVAGTVGRYSVGLKRYYTAVGEI